MKQSERIKQPVADSKGDTIEITLLSIVSFVEAIVIVLLLIERHF